MYSEFLLNSTIKHHLEILRFSWDIKRYIGNKFLCLASWPLLKPPVVVLYVGLSTWILFKLQQWKRDFNDWTRNSTPKKDTSIGILMITVPRKTIKDQIFLNTFFSTKVKSLEIYIMHLILYIYIIFYLNIMKTQWN